MTEKNNNKKSKWTFPKIIITALVIIVFLILSSPLPLIPEIGRDLQQSGYLPEIVFSERIKKAFPLTTPEEIVVVELENQGFKIRKNEKIAYFSKSKFPCKYTWSVWWKTDDKMLIKKIDASYGTSCL